tara:strand:- start:3409 stop:4332 length:924 start_codon:yes stop_codon:yes gene_type:complete
MFKKIAFMGTPDFSLPILKSLYQNGYPISVVYSQPPKKSMRGQKINKSSVQKMAENLNLKVRTPENLKGNQEELKYFKSIEPDIVVVVAYGKLIPKEFLDIPKSGFLNIHASLLPKWRGAAPIQRSIMNLDEKTGISIMQLNEELDSGPVMLKQEIKLDDKINSEQLSIKLSELGSKIISDCLDLIEVGKAKFVVQNHSEATYAKKIRKDETKIDWNQNAKTIIGKINGLSPMPGAWFNFDNKRHKILSADLVKEEGTPGLLLDNNLTIGCKQNSIRINLIQKEGKNIQKCKEFLLGSNLKKGSILK